MEQKRRKRNPALADREEALLINWSIIGQQSVLNSSNTAQINNTFVQSGRERGTGEIAGQTTIRTTTSVFRNSNTISDVNDSSSLSNNSARLQRRRNVFSSNDTFSRNMRPRRLNIQGGISPGAILPPSTSQDGLLNVSYLFNHYNSFASSLDSLSREHRLKTILAHSRF